MEGRPEGISALHRNALSGPPYSGRIKIEWDEIGIDILDTPIYIAYIN